MLTLTYTRESDEFAYVTVLGDLNGIRDLYWQLTRNYEARDGTAIGDIKVRDLQGNDVTETFECHPVCTTLSKHIA